MILETADSKVAHVVGEALQGRDGEGAYREVVVGEVLSIDSDEERAIPNAKSDLEELASYKGELSLGLLIIAGKAEGKGRSLNRGWETRREDSPVVLALVATRHGRPVEVHVELEYHSPRIIALEAYGELRAGRPLRNALHGHHGACLVASWHIALEGNAIGAQQAARKHQRKEHAMMELRDLFEVPVGTHVIDLLGKLHELKGSVELIVYIDLEAALQHGNTKGEALPWYQWILRTIAFPILRYLLLLPALARLEHATYYLSLSKVRLNLQEDRFAFSLLSHIVR